MIQITDKKKCCGCSACAQICPRQCITMQEDEQGFLYPKVDKDACVACHLCEKVCPVLNQREDKQPTEVYAAKNPNEEVRLKSSSGGIFSILAEKVLEEKGVVFGAKFNDKWEVEHGYIEDINDLDNLRRSKYVQSNIKDNYKKAEEFLKQGRKVLFTGTPCQIAGLKNYLRKDYDNLLCVDVVCHGAPSPRVWRDYLSFIRRPEGAGVGKNTVSFSCLKEMPVITGISFRDKSTGWQKYGFNVLIASEVSNQNSVSRPLNTIDKNVFIHETLDKNIFMQGFLKDLYLRESCYHCPAKKGKSHSDITLADFWGINNVFPKINDDKGVSVVMINSEKGKQIFDSLEIEKYRTDFSKAKQLPMEYSVKEPKQRKEFWQRYTTEGIACIEPICNKMKPNVIRRTITFGKRCTKKILGQKVVNTIKSVIKK